MAQSKPINPLKSFPYDILHQIINDIGASDPVQLHQLLQVDRFSHSLVRQHPAWYGHLVLEHTETWAIGIFNSQLVACKEHKRPTDVKIHLGHGTPHKTDIQDRIFVKIMAILPFTKTISLKLRLADPQTLWQRFATLPVLQLESLHINLMNQQGNPEQLVLPAQPFSGQAPLLKDVNALFDYSSLAINPFDTVKSVCWELSNRQAEGAFRGSNIVAHYPNARKLVFNGDYHPGLPDLFDSAPGLWRLEDVEIWGVESVRVLVKILADIATPSIRRISLEGCYAWAGPESTAFIRSCLPQGEPLTFKALVRKEKYEELRVLSMSTKSGKTIEFRQVPILDLWVSLHSTITRSFTSYLANVTQLEFDIQFWNHIIKSNVPFSAVHTLVLHVNGKLHCTTTAVQCSGPTYAEHLRGYFARCNRSEHP
ncbi:hypothetical protein BKA62DRAFT_785067 [Auriculariales sp. MPI-PUGE-AT-0066]|nr:hypothetical protein BKA62DRAFT_785067 [Auriculariales sp. MPI-PUGE-AT-0066]